MCLWNLVLFRNFFVLLHIFSILLFYLMRRAKEHERLSAGVPLLFFPDNLQSFGRVLLFLVERSSADRFYDFFLSASLNPTLRKEMQPCIRSFAGMNEWVRVNLAGVHDRYFADGWGPVGWWRHRIPFPKVATPLRPEIPCL